MRYCGLCLSSSSTTRFSNFDGPSLLKGAIAFLCASKWFEMLQSTRAILNLSPQNMQWFIKVATHVQCLEMKCRIYSAQSISPNLWDIQSLLQNSTVKSTPAAPLYFFRLDFLGAHSVISTLAARSFNMRPLWLSPFWFLSLDLCNAAPRPTPLSESSTLTLPLSSIGNDA